MAWRIFFGTFILLIAVGFALDVLIIDTNSKFRMISILSNWWPCLIVAIGLNQLLLHKEQPWGALTIFAIGSIMLVFNLDESYGILGGTDSHWKNWGVVLLSLGIVVLTIRMMLPRRLRRYQSQTLRGVKPRFLHVIKDMMIFGAAQVRNDSQQFSGGKVTTIMGDYEIDLRGAMLEQNGANMLLIACFGTVGLHIPQQMVLELNVIPVLGGIENTTEQIVTKADGVPALRIKCIAIFGVIEISN